MKSSRHFMGWISCLVIAIIAVALCGSCDDIPSPGITPDIDPNEKPTNPVLPNDTTDNPNEKPDSVPNSSITYKKCTINNVTFYLDLPIKGEASLASWDMNLTELIIPDNIEWEGITYPVTQLGDPYMQQGNQYGNEEWFSPFDWGRRLRRVIIGDNVTSLPLLTFSNGITGQERHYIEEIQFGKGIKAIPFGCVLNCRSLKKVTMYSPESIGHEAFEGCTSLTSITYLDSATKPENATDKDALYLPSSVKTIGTAAFTYTPFKKLLLNKSNITNAIDSFWFMNITEATLPASLSIIEGTFNGCDKLQVVNLYADNSIISTGTFADCSSLKKIKTNGLISIVNENWTTDNPIIKLPSAVVIYAPKNLETQYRNLYIEKCGNQIGEACLAKFHFVDNPMNN